jgi:gentisate 1,2-dioxygenase
LSRRRCPLTSNRKRRDVRRELNLFDELIRIRDEQREKAKSAVWLIKGKDLPWEINRHGKMQWYLHPSLDDVACRTALFYRQEIPGGSNSGRQKCQGSIVFYVLKGRGYTIVDGIRHPWKMGDVINLPIKEEGIVYQHFNAASAEPVLLVGCEPNLVDPLGVDKGCGFEELEDAPEYRESRS